MPHQPSRNPIGTPFVELQSVDSTNNYALAQVHAGLASHGHAFFTHEQVAGKGQRGRTWLAEKNSSLILSVVIDPAPLLLSEQFQLSACTALSVCEFFSQYAGHDTSIKWPNDLYWQDRKAGGILIENIIGPKKVSDNGWQCAIMGMGININQPAFDPSLKNPVSLRQVTGREYDTAVLARELCFILDKNLNDLCDNGFTEIYNAYNNRLYRKDQKAKFKKGSRVFEANVRNVSRTGKLVVQHTIEEEINWGEVEWIIG